MRRRAVVALEEVLHHDLPVRLDRPLVMGVEADRADVEPALGHDRGQPAECRLERPRVGVGVHEDERTPGAHRHGREREARGIESGLALRARRSPQRSVQVVRPRVIRALERLATPDSIDDEVPSVAAHVDQPAKGPFRIAYDGDGKPAAHFFAVAIVLSGRSGLSRCGKIEKPTMPSVSSPPVGGVQPTKSCPILGVITMLPALSPT